MGWSFPKSCWGLPKDAPSSNPAMDTAQYTHACTHTAAGVTLDLCHKLQITRTLSAWCVIWSQRLCSATPAPCFNGTRCIYRSVSVPNKRALWKWIPSSASLLALQFTLLDSQRAHKIDSSRLKIDQKVNLRSAHYVLLTLWVFGSWD